MRAAHTHTCAKLLQTAITTTKLLAALSLAMWEDREMWTRERKSRELAKPEKHSTTTTTTAATAGKNCLIINCRKAKQSSKTWQQGGRPCERASETAVEISAAATGRVSRAERWGERDEDKFLLKDTHGL